MIFVKNPVLGKVKTRLAKTIGAEHALKVFQQLLEHTHQITSKVRAHKVVFYSDFIDTQDIWHEPEFQKMMQKGETLGDKMSNAFLKAFDLGYKRVVIIGSDNIEIDNNIIHNAFEILNVSEVVIGPAKDGGYYLLGMRNHHIQLFENKTWSTASVLNDTLADLKELNLTYKLLPTLSDIDVEADLLNYPIIID